MFINERIFEVIFPYSPEVEIGEEYTEDIGDRDNPHWMEIREHTRTIESPFDTVKITGRIVVHFVISDNDTYPDGSHRRTVTHTTLEVDDEPEVIPRKD